MVVNVNNMASSKTFDFSIPTLETNDPVILNGAKIQQSPIKEFHNRSKLFPNSQTNRLFQKSSKHPVHERKFEDQEFKLISHRPPISAKKSNRAQSAKSRIEGNWKLDSNYCNSESCENTSHLNKTKNKPSSHLYEEHDKQIVPHGGIQVPVFDVGDNAPFPAYNFQEKKNSKYVHKSDRRFSFKNEGNLIDLREYVTVAEKTTATEEKERIRPSSAKCSHVKNDNISPVVYNLATNQKIFGEETSTIKSSEHGTCYRLADDSFSNTVHKVGKKNWCAPETLDAIMPWKSECYTKEELGIDPSKCLVFLPSLSVDSYKDLPVVPAPMSADEDLPYKEKVKPPIVHKKYSHPAWKKKHIVDEWTCSHTKPETTSYGYDFGIFETRTAAVIRKEIEDLENLMKGIGTFDSDCMMVRYQAEIEKFWQTYRDTMALVPERLLNSPVSVDTFGLRQFYQEHDEIMLEIRHRHSLCIKELAQLEAEASISSDRKYFKHVVHNTFQYVLIGVLFQTDEWTNLSHHTGSYDFPGSCDLEYMRYDFNGSDSVIAGQTVYNISADGILGLIAFTSCSLSPVVMKVANVLNTLLINVVRGHCPKISDGVLISTVPNCPIQNSLFVDIALYMRWRRVNIIYDSTGGVCIQDLLNRLSVHSISSNAVFLRDGSKISPSLAVIGQDWLKEVIYVTTDKHTALEIVSEAMALGMFNNSYFWVLNLDPHALWDSGLYKPVHNGYVLVVTSRPEHNGTDDHFLGNSELRVYSTVKSSRMPLQEVGVYTPDSGLNVSDNNLYRNIFKGFDNRTLTVVSVVGEPFQMRVDEGNGSFHFYGFTYDLLNEFSKEFNFRYKTGMIGMVMRGEADIAVGGITITVERKAVVDFLYPYQEEGIGIIMRKVDDKAGKMFRVYSPLGSDSWLASGVAVFVAGIVLSLIAKLSPFDSGIKESVLRSFWLAFSTFLHQGEDQTPTSASGRIVLGIWWIFTIIVMSLYTANLAAFLTVSLAKAPVKNLEELSSQTVYKPLVKDGTNLYALFQNAKGGLYKKIWEMMAGMPKITESVEAYEMILEGKYAYLTDESEVKYKAMLDCKHLEVAEETFHKAELSFVIRKDAEFKDAFNYHMLKMVEGGIVDKYKSKWWPKYTCDTSTSATELTFESTSGIFIVYSGFILMSVICCLVELLLIQGRKYTRNKVQSPKVVKEIPLVVDGLEQIDLETGFKKMNNTEYKSYIIQGNDIFEFTQKGNIFTYVQHKISMDSEFGPRIAAKQYDIQVIASRTRDVTSIGEYHQLISNIKMAIHVHSSSKAKLKFEEVAKFTVGNGLITRYGGLYSNNFRDFENRVLKVASVRSVPHVMKGMNNNGSSYYYGFCYDILRDFAETFNFRYQSVDAIDGLYGNPTDDGLNATGMVGMVMRGEVDIGVAPFALTAKRDRVIDYVIPFQEDGVGILMKKVENKADKFFRIFLPLDYTSWLGIIVATVMTSYILYFIAKFSPQSSPRDLPLSSNFWLIVGTVYGQDDGTRPTFESGRIILGFWWVFTILITASYTANLAAFLTISLAKPPVKNLEELASQTIYKPLLVQETNHHAMFKEATHGLYKRIWNMMSDMPKIKTVEEGYELVKTGQYALLWDYSQFQYLINNDCGSLEIAQEYFNKLSLSFIIPENAPFKKAFDDQ
ncbi:uncharacterized protein LOC134274897 [Saccostrea cucullata]|uniref:uncharacterized protein LOC134274897 n=1 Tax=Saccostrea cuccullata TaxID=36930 RepID=UPI002ED404DA